jgi:glycine/D-amino acid oxidase-like deaminating enzyme
VIRTVVGLRPYRPSGFVVRREAIQEKTIVHNYGHGGGGITLSWGTAHLAVEQALPTGAMRMAVLGSGAVGLATARLLVGQPADAVVFTHHELVAAIGELRPRARLYAICTNRKNVRRDSRNSDGHVPYISRIACTAA